LPWQRMDEIAQAAKDTASGKEDLYEREVPQEKDVTTCSLSARSRMVRSGDKKSERSHQSEQDNVFALMPRTYRRNRKLERIYSFSHGFEAYFGAPS